MESRLKAAVANTGQIFKSDQAKTLLPKKINPSPNDTLKRRYRKRPGL
jgi:hypothetical protein